MYITQVYLSSPIQWSITAEDPKLLSLDTIDDLSIVNPLLYPDISKQSPNEIRDNRILILDKKYLYESRILLFVSAKELKDEEFKRLSSALFHFLNNLRFCSKQVSISKRVGSLLKFEIDELPEINHPEPSDSKGMVRKHIVDSAANYKHIKRADEYGVDNNPEVYHGLLLDAIEAAFTEDFRKALLYSAIAIETIATKKLDEKYEDILSDTPKSDNHRIREFQVRTDEVQTKDPIFEYLSESKAFSTLLHEQPLYLYNRSLLIEEEAIFQQSVRLYRTRNKIAHSGKPPEDGDFFRYTLEDAQKAIKTTLKVFEWYGDSEEYVLPFDISFVEFLQAKDN